jgi:7,8-dihydroneopterin aldolase/epimerase/oxygenase
MDKIIIHNLETWYCVGVPDDERAQPQRLLLEIEMEYDTAKAAESDDLADTVDYHSIAERLLNFGEDRTWHLIEKLAADVAEFIMREYGVPAVTVEVRKMVLTAAEHVAVRIRRTRRGDREND